MDNDNLQEQITFLRERITALRMRRGVSEYQMSLDLGHSRGYIQNISRGKSLPSIEGLLEICDYFDISPAQFFDDGMNDPALIAAAVDGLRKLNDSDRLMVLNQINRLLQG